ncbi:MAG TPA: response regulator, partial [Burkholderiales bacterium]|nr:response regulator [Burkholderiales bacterium]
GEDLAVPSDYRRILWLMDFQGHAGLISTMLKSISRSMLDDWLGEMEEIGLIEAVPEGEEALTDFAAAADWTLKLSDLDRDRLKQDTQAASDALASSGAYVATHRLRERAAAGKAPADTTVLIVEDDPDQLALADLRISMAGYRVRVANSVNGFLQTMLDDGAPDLLLLDVALPDGDGFDVLARLRRHQALGSLPIVMLTAKREPADIGRGLALGADGYVTKPYTRNVVADVIRRVLKQENP